MFKVLGVLLLLYVGYALSIGEVFAKRGGWDSISKRDKDPLRYWSTIGVYVLLSIALIVFF